MRRKRRSGGWPKLIPVAILGVGIHFCSHATRSPREPSANEPHIRVMTYNVNFGLAGSPGVIGAIDRADCDVVFLQETTPDWEQALRGELGARYPRMEFRHAEAGAGGQAVLSKFPIRPGKLIEPPRGGWFPGWIVTLQTPLGEIQVLNVHLRPQVSDSGGVVSGYFTTDEIRHDQMRAFVEHLDPDLPTLILGDFNESRSGDSIAYLKGKGFASALPEFSPSQPTWQWHTSLGTITHQLDHIVYDERLEPLNVWVVPEGDSDHFPVVGIFVLAGRAGP